MRIKSDHWLYKTPIAHRGLWNAEIPENTLPAFKNAIAHGYACEIDVYITTDDEIIVFHDDDLMRLTGTPGIPWEKSYAELSQLKINGTEEKIPTLKEVLDTVNGQTPLLIEIKPTQNIKVVDKVVDILRDYKGDFAIQSFNPKQINRVKKLAPDYIRGVLGMPKLFKIKAFDLFMVKYMPINFIVKPDFISYYFDALPLPKFKVKNKVKLAWTITSQESANTLKEKGYADNIIFENFLAEK